MPDITQPLLDVRDLTIEFATDRGPFEAVKQVSFSVAKGETLAIVGESGSGKSVSALSLTRLLPAPPARYKSGSILWKGEDVLAMDHRRLRGIRGGQIATSSRSPRPR